MRNLLLFFLLMPVLTLAQTPTPPKFELQGNALQLPSPIVFETASDKLKPESDAALAHVAAYLTAKDYITLLRIENHSDNDGNAVILQNLSEKRALAVAKALVAKGVKCERVMPVGFGATKPMAPNDTLANKALNRRTMFVNAALRGRAIGGMPVDGGGKVGGDPCR